jgi:hypothetical protein
MRRILLITALAVASALTLTASTSPRRRAIASKGLTGAIPVIASLEPWRNAGPLHPAQTPIAASTRDMHPGRKPQSAWAARSPAAPWALLQAAGTALEAV